MTDALDLHFSPNSDLSSLRPCADVSLVENRSLNPEDTEFDSLARLLEAFIDQAATSMNRGSFYNKKADVKAREEQLHQWFLEIDRGLYGLTLTLPGATDYSRQMGIRHLLSANKTRSSSLLSVDEEERVFEKLISMLKPTRLLKLFVQLKEQKINNARTRRLILRSVLRQGKLELWSTRYRKKLRVVLTHAWGQRMTGILRSILRKDPAQLDVKEKGILTKQILNYRGNQSGTKVLECVAFILGLEDSVTLPLLKAYVGAKTKLELGRSLSFETLEGLRSTFHKEVLPGVVLKMTAKNLTKGQRMVLQSKAEAEGVKVAFNPENYDAVKLYLYAFERGLSTEIEAVLNRRGRELAARLKMPYRRVAIIVDASGSMAGADSQALRPMAVSLALRDGLEAAADEATVLVCGGRPLSGARLIYPEGGTALAEALLEAMKGDPEAVFILSDGYENSPAGRTRAVLTALQELGYRAPVFQLSSVFAAETGSLRELAPGLIGALPVGKPEALGLTLFKALLKNDALRGLQVFVNQALENIGVREALPRISKSLKTVAVRGEGQ